MSAADASLAPKVSEAGMPAMTSSGTSTTAATGATLATVRVVASVSTAEPDVTCSVTATGPAGPSPRPRAASLAGVRIGLAPVASSNWPSPSTSQANVAPVGAIVAVPARVSPPPSSIV